MSVTLHTNLGDLKFELFCSQAPKACKNFLALAASGYYQSTKFHRSMKGFMVQGGDPTGTGKGGTSIYGGLFGTEVSPSLKHDKRGVLSMANTGKPDSNGSQFFITYAKQPHLNGKYTIFGHLIDGLSVLGAMEREPVDEKHRPVKDIVVQGVTIHANPIADAEALAAEDD